MKKALTMIVSIVIFSMLGFVFIPGFIDVHQSRASVKGVLENVIDQEYEHAFESIYFYDVATDLELTISYEDAKNEWVQRVAALKEQGVFLVYYSQLQVDLDEHIQRER